MSRMGKMSMSRMQSLQATQHSHYRCLVEEERAPRMIARETRKMKRSRE